MNFHKLNISMWSPPDQETDYPFPKALLNPFPVITLPLRSLATIPTSYSMVQLTYFWTLYKWNYRVCTPSRVASFAQLYVCCISFARFHCRIAFHGVNVPQFIHYVVNRYLGSFQFGAVMNRAIVNILVCVFWWAYVCFCWGCT